MSTDKARRWKRPDWLRITPAAARTIAAAIPVALVNAVAFAGQLAFLRAHLPWPLTGQVMMALALESIAIYLAWHAHLAALANDSALRLRLGAYAFAVVIGACNYSHYAGPGWRPTFAAVALGLMSVSSPFLWSIHSRRVSRDALMARGLVEPHALRLGATRWTWHPYRSARVMWVATWEGVADPAEALRVAAERSAQRKARQQAAKVEATSHQPASVMASPPAAGDATSPATGEPEAKPQAEPPGEPEAKPRSEPGATSRQPEASKARAAYRRSVQAGDPLSDRALGAMFERGRTWGANRIRECQDGLKLADVKQPAAGG